MFRQNTREDGVTVSKDEIVSFGYHRYFVLNKITGECTGHAFKKAQTCSLPLTGVPIMIYDAFINTIEIKYEDHIDLFDGMTGKGIFVGDKTPTWKRILSQ